PMQLVEVAEDRLDIIQRVGTVWMAGELGDLPGRETGKDAGRELPALRLQPVDLILDVDLGLRGDVPQLFDFGFELGDGLFEIQKGNGHVVFTGISSSWREVTAFTVHPQTTRRHLPEANH